MVYFIKSSQIQKLRYLLQFLSNTDKKDEIYTPPEPPAKKQRLTSRACGKCIDAFRIKQKYLSPELVKLIQRSNIDRSVYITFKNQLLTSGIIKWRYNKNGRNVCAMNDYSMIPNSFVHVSAEASGNGTHSPFPEKCDHHEIVTLLFLFRK